MTPRDLMAAFDTVAEAPDGVKRLRELVLQLAVRGKLVAQAAGDEPASVLLERIAAEKARLLKAKKIRKPKALPPVSRDEVPFEVPKGWAWTRLDTLVEPERPVSYGVLVPGPHEPEGVPLVRVAELHPSAPPAWPAKSIGDAVASRYQRVVLRGDEVLVGVVGSIGKVGVAHPNWEGAVVARAVARFGLVADCERPYLVSYLLAPSAQAFFREAARTMAQPTLNVGLLRQLQVPVPPLPEQKRIVARVDELMGLLDRLEAARNAREATRTALRDAALAALADADTPEEVAVAWERIAGRMDDLFTEPGDVEPLRQTVLQLAVRGRLVAQDPGDEPAGVLLERIAVEKARMLATGELPKTQKPKNDPIQTMPTVPATWATPKLDLISYVVDPNPSHRNPAYREQGFPFISTQEFIGREGLILDTPRRVAEETVVEQEERCRFTERSIAFSRKGTIGKTRLLPGGVRFALLDSLCVVSPSRHLSARYLNYALRSASIVGQVELMTRGLALRQISVGRVRLLRTPLPPYAEQKRIVAKVDELMTLLDRLCKHLNEKTTAHDAFAAAAVHRLEA